MYKPIDAPQVPEGSDEQLTLVPTEDPDYNRLPWAAAGPVAWTMQIIVGCLVGAVVVGAVVSWRASVRARRAGGGDSSGSRSRSSSGTDEEDVDASKGKNVRSSRRATVGMTNEHVPNGERSSDEEDNDVE